MGMVELLLGLGVGTGLGALWLILRESAPAPVLSVPAVSLPGRVADRNTTARFEPYSDTFRRSGVVDPVARLRQNLRSVPPEERRLPEDAPLRGPIPTHSTIRPVAPASAAPGTGATRSRTLSSTAPRLVPTVEAELEPPTPRQVIVHVYVNGELHRRDSASSSLLPALLRA